MYVYMLKSLSKPDQRYIGLTKNLKERLNLHNSGAVIHTKKFKPWKFLVVVWFADEHKAVEMERYLKTGSGCAFRKRHFE